MKWLLSLVILNLCVACSLSGCGTSNSQGENPSELWTGTPAVLYLPNISKDHATQLEVVEISVTPDPAVIETKVAEAIAATQEAMPTPTFVDTLTPTSIPTPTIEMMGIGGNYTLETERNIAGYTIRLWKDYEEDFFFTDMVTISALNQPQIYLEYVTDVDWSGTDITGEGHPDLVVQQYSGGAHCCFHTEIVDLGEQPMRVLDLPWSNCFGEMKDLNNDGLPEYVTCDDSFAYYYCSFASSPMVTAVLQYEPAIKAYLPVSNLYPELFYDNLARVQELAAYGTEWGNDSWDDTNKCTVLPLVLDYLYMGQIEQAWNALYQYYFYPDIDAFWAETIDIVEQSLLYPRYPSIDPQQLDYIGIDHLMRAAQKAHAYAHATGDTSQLSSYYLEQALDRNTELINRWHVPDRCRLTIYPVKDMSVYVADDPSDGQAQVSVTKTETREYYCDGEIDTALSAFDETYTAAFTVEKINGRWYITVRP